MGAAVDFEAGRGKDPREEEEEEEEEGSRQIALQMSSGVRTSKMERGSACALHATRRLSVTVCFARTPSRSLLVNIARKNSCFTSSESCARLLCSGVF